jgi:hypothetical protein
LSTPEQIEQQIEGTRRSLSSDVDRLAEKVSPGRVVSRRVDRVRSRATSLREKIMGAAPDTRQVRARTHDAAGSAKDGMSTAIASAGEAGSAVADAVASAPEAARRQAQGSPLGAGLVAFGVGMLLSSLLPASDREKELAAQAEQVAAEPLQDKANELAGQLQDSAQQSARQIKHTASQAASQTVEDARSATQDAKAPLQQ